MLISHFPLLRLTPFVDAHRNHIPHVSRHRLAIATKMHNGRPLKKADPSTIQDKLLVGYQGWFTCGGDGEPGEPPLSLLSFLRFSRLPATSVCFAHIHSEFFFALPMPGSSVANLRNVRLVKQSEEVTMDGFIGSITPYRTVDVPIRTSGRTFQSTTPRSYTRRRDSEPRVAKNVICSLQGTERLLIGQTGSSYRWITSNRCSPPGVCCS